MRNEALPGLTHKVEDSSLLLASLVKENNFCLSRQEAPAPCLSLLFILYLKNKDKN
jgi:hypothetical protein